MSDRRAKRAGARTKALLIGAVLSLIAAAGEAASPEDDYVAARDRFIATFHQHEATGKVGDRVVAQERRARRDLEQMLRRIIGTTAPRGFSGAGTISLDTLFSEDVGFGMLDGLVFKSPNRKTQVLVTTDGLLERWLRARPADPPLPKSVPAALGDAEFYTFAISNDAAVAKYAALPVGKPAKATLALAMLDARSQDILPLTPSELIVAVAAGGKVFIATAPVEAKVAAIPACDAIWQDAEKKANALFEAYRASDSKDEKQFNQYTKAQEEGATAVRRCFGERAPNEPFFAAVTKQAQALVDRVAGR
jgi:hypothetical protein